MSVETNKGNSGDKKTNTTTNNALSHFLLILAKLRDIIYKDFMDDFPSYMKNFPKELKITKPEPKKNDGDSPTPNDESSTSDEKKQVEVSSFVEFSKACNTLNAMEKLNDKKFFEAILKSHFTRMGFDITDFEDSKKLTDLIRSILALVLKIVPLLKQLIGIIDDGTIQEHLKKINPDPGGTNQDNENLDLKGLFKDPQWEDIEKLKFNDKDSIFGKILTLIIDFIKLIRKNEDFDAKNFGNETHFGEFLNKTHAKNKFPERLFNHLFVLMISKSKEILANDLKEITDGIAKITDEEIESIENTNDISDAEKKLVQKILHFIKIAKPALETSKKIDEYLENIKKTAKKDNTDSEASKIQIPPELKIQKKIIDAKLDRLANDTFWNYNLAGKICHAVYTVLDFIKIIDKDRILVAKYALDDKKDGILKFPYLFESYKADKWFYKDKDDEGNEINPPLILPYDEVTKKIAKAIKGASEKFEDVHVTCWRNFGDLFQNPVKYFNKLYPINNKEDAEEFFAKIVKIAKSFNPYMPDYDSVYQMLYELLFRVKDKINEFDTEIAKIKKEKGNDADTAELNQVNETFKNFANFIIDLLKVFEGFAIHFKDKLAKPFKDYIDTDAQNEDKNENNKDDNIISKLKTAIDVAFTEYQGTFIDHDDDSLKDIFITPMIEALYEKSSDFEIFEHISKEEWEEIIRADTHDLIGSYRQTLESLKDEIIMMKTSKNVDKEGNTSTEGNKEWDDRFKGFIAQMKTEFDTQTKEVPDNYDNLMDTGKNYFGYQLDKSKTTYEKIENPFSNFDYTSYLLTLSAKVRSLVLYNDSLCYIKFRENEPLFDKLKDNSTVKGKMGESTDTLKHLIDSAFTAYWPKMEKKIQKCIAKPLYDSLDKVVAKWVKENLLSEASIKGIQEKVKEKLTFKDEEIDKLFKDEAVKKIVKNLLLLSDIESENKDEQKKKDIEDSLAYWKNALQFAINLHKIVPQTIKDYLRDLVNIPDIGNESFMTDYNLDIKNRFLSVTLYDNYKKNDEKDNIDPKSLNASIGLVAFIGEREIEKKPNEKEKVWGLYLLPKLKVNAGFPKIDLGETHSLQFSASADLNKDPDNKTGTDSNVEEDLVKDKLGVFLSSQDNKINADWIDGKNLEAYLNLEFSRKQEKEAITIFDADFAALTLKNYPQKLFVGYKKGFDFGYLGKLDTLVFTLKLRELNDFFKMILSNDIEIEVGTLSLGLSLKDGFDINGQFKVRIPINVNIDLSVIKFSNLVIELGSGDMRNIMAQLLTNFTVDFQGIALSFIEMGFGMDVNYMKPDGTLGELDLSPHFQFPSGISIAINLAAVKGVGIIKWNQEKEEFFGAVSLNIMDICGASMMILFNMKLPDGEEGFSFMGALSVFFTSGIQIGMGFAITAIGGSVGINRRIDIETLQKAVRDGSLGTVLFVQELEKNIDTVINNISSYYPIQKDQFFFGFLAQITWGTVLKIDAGLFIQAPNPVVIILAGALHVSISDEAENLIAIHVYFIGGIDFSKGLFFDASLVDSQIVGLKLEGDMALRLYWTGAQKGFILSAGGFHPQFTPATGFNLGKMKRLAIRLNYGDLLNISLETYFAVTSNTVQFGADLQIKIGWDSVGIFGGLSFDALFYFKPFSFNISTRAYLAAKLLRCTLMAIDTSFSLGGPAPWTAKGSAKFTILFIKVKMDFNETWGKRQKDTEIEHISVIELLKNNFNEKSNWKIIVGDSVDQLVQFVRIENKDEEVLIMQSSDQLSFSQDAVPLKELMEKFGEATPEDAKKIELAEVTINDTKAAFEETRSSFAPSMIRKYSNDEKLRLPSYEDMRSGFNLIEMPDADLAATGIDCSELHSYFQEIKEDVRNKWAEYVRIHS